jgi:hypothetical protein
LAPLPFRLSTKGLSSIQFEHLRAGAVVRSFPKGRTCRSCRPRSTQRMDVRPFVVAVLTTVALIAVLALASLLLI